MIDFQLVFSPLHLSLWLHFAEIIYPKSACKKFNPLNTIKNSVFSYIPSKQYGRARAVTTTMAANEAVLTSDSCILPLNTNRTRLTLQWSELRHSSSHSRRSLEFTETCIVECSEAIEPSQVFTTTQRCVSESLKSVQCFKTLSSAAPHRTSRSRYSHFHEVWIGYDINS